MRTPAAWLRRVRRRTPGIYAYRTRRHANPRRIEWGYVGESHHLEMRHQCHGGACRHVNCAEKPWWDLVVHRRTIRLPWWLGWKWILRPLETVVIALLRPRYNVAKNKRWTRTPLVVQRLQRANRDVERRLSGAPVYRERITRAAAPVYVWTLGLLMTIVGTGGWWITR